MTQRFQLTKDMKLMHYLSAFGYMVIAGISLYAYFSHGPYRTVGYFYELFAALIFFSFAFIALWLSYRSRVEISSEGVLCHFAFRKFFVRWEDIDRFGKIRGHGHTVFIICSDIQTVTRTNFLLDWLLKKVGLRNTIPINQFIADWQEVLAEYIKEYTIPVT